MDLLLERLEAIGLKTLVLSIAVDRITRSNHQYSRLCDQALSGRHGVVSFLWDNQTDLTVSTALCLPETELQLLQWQDNLDLQNRAQPDSLVLPVVQPIMWVHGSDHRSSAEIEGHPVRPMRNVEEWIQAGGLTSYQGDMGLIPDQLSKDTRRGFTVEMTRYVPVLLLFNAGAATTIHVPWRTMPHNSEMSVARLDPR